MFDNRYYEKDYYLRASDFESNFTLKPSSILDIFQDVAGCHANDLGSGFIDLVKRNLAWVLISTKYELYKNPPMYSTLRAKTWPLKSNGVKFQREYLLYLDGELVAKGTSMWTIIDYKERRVSVQKEIYSSMESMATETNFDEKLKKLSDFESEYSVQVSPKRSEIDINRHLNNIYYSTLVVDNMRSTLNESVRKFQIDYNKEVLLNDIIDLHFKREGDKVFSKGNVGERNAFIVELELEETNILDELQND